MPNRRRQSVQTQSLGLGHPDAIRLAQHWGEFAQIQALHASQIDSQQSLLHGELFTAATRGQRAFAPQHAINRFGDEAAVSVTELRVLAEIVRNDGIRRQARG